MLKDVSLYIYIYIIPRDALDEVGRIKYTCIVTQVQRLREELTSSRAQLATWDERINQARAACAAWQLESEEAKRKATIAEQQRDEVNIPPCKIG